MRYQISDEFHQQFPATGTNPPAKIPLKNGVETVLAYADADAFNNDIALDAFVKVCVAGRTYSMTVGAASDLIDQLDEALVVAQREQDLFAEYKREQARIEREAKAALPHPRAVVVSKPGVSPQYRIWCDDRGIFWYDWKGSVLPPTKFIPGKEFQRTDAFKTTPENVALWIKLAAEAAGAAEW